MSTDTNRTVPRLNLPTADSQLGSDISGTAAAGSSDSRLPNRRRRSSAVDIIQGSFGPTSPPPSSPGLSPSSGPVVVITTARGRSASVASDRSDADREEDTRVHSGRRLSFLEAGTQSNSASDRSRVQAALAKNQASLAKAEALREDWRAYPKASSHSAQTEEITRGHDESVARLTTEKSDLQKWHDELNQSEQSERFYKKGSSKGAQEG